MDQAAEHASQLTALVLGIMVLMLFAALTAVLSSRLPKLPFTIALVLLGIILAGLARQFPAFAMFAQFELTPELVLFVFLPTLIYESAYSLDARQLQRNLVPVLTLAVPGLLLSTAIIGGIFHAFTEYSLIVSLLLGAILSATDPVAVIALFKQLGVPSRLTVLVEGESLFNDATSLVLAGLLLAIAVSGDITTETVASGVGEFLLVFFGGILVGWVLSLAACELLGLVDANPAVEISFTTILAYLSFILAEHGFHVSGIMAVVAAGLTVASYGRAKISPSTEEYMHHFWDYAAWLANAFIFLLVGLTVDTGMIIANLDLVIVVVIAMLISRAVVVFGVVPLIGRKPGAEGVSRAYQAVMYWGGLRGAIALAIVLSLPEFSYRDTLVAVVTGAVLFTLLVQGLSMEWLVKRLGLDQPDLADQLAEYEGELQAKLRSLAQVEILVTDGFFSASVARRRTAEMEDRIAQLRGRIGERRGDLEASTELRILSLRVLVRERSRFDELFRRGLIGESAYRELSHHVSCQFDDAKHSHKLPDQQLSLSLTRLFVRKLLGYLARTGIGETWVEHRLHLQMLCDYEIAWARFRSANSVLKDLDEIVADAGLGGEAVVQIADLYRQLRETRKGEVDEFAQLYPEFVDAVQDQLGHRLTLITERTEIERVASHGILPAGVSTELLKAQDKRLRELRNADLSSYLDVAVEELLAKVPMFSALEPSQFSTLARHLHERSIPRDESIIVRGDIGDSLFLIVRGVAEVVTEDGEVISRLTSGDFFGERALLQGTPRNSTVRAATPCTCYELHRREWQDVCANHADIRAAVESVDRAR